MLFDPPYSTGSSGILQKDLAGACYNKAPVCVVLQQDTSLCYNKTPFCVTHLTTCVMQSLRKRLCLVVKLHVDRHSDSARCASEATTLPTTQTQRLTLTQRMHSTR